MAKIKLKKDKDYNIQPIRGENYDDCDFIFGAYKTIAVDGQYFQTIFPGHAELDRIWWDSEGFHITEI